MHRFVPARRRLHVLRRGVFAVVMMAGLAPAAAAERGFPFDRELMLDAKPMKGSKRIPMLGIGPRGEASIDLWCNTVKAQLDVAGDAITIKAGARTEQQCAPERMRGDDDLLAALVAVTNWQRLGDLLTLRGPKTLRFRTATH